MHDTTKVAAELLENPETEATVIHYILLRKYGEELYSADPVDIYARIGADFHAQLSEEGENRLNALLLALTTDAPYDEEEPFEAVCMALASGTIPDGMDGAMEGIDGLTVAEMLWGVYEMSINLDEVPEFSEAVVHFMARVMEEEMSEDGAKHIDGYMAEKREHMKEAFGRLGVPAADMAEI